MSSRPPKPAIRSLVITATGVVTEAALTKLIPPIQGECVDGRRVCLLPDLLPHRGYLYVWFDDDFLAHGSPVNNHARGLYNGDLCGTVVLQACNEVGETVDLPLTMTADNWRAEIERYRSYRG